MEILNPQILSGTSPCFSPKKHRYKYNIPPKPSFKRNSSFPTYYLPLHNSRNFQIFSHFGRPTSRHRRNSLRKKLTFGDQQEQEQVSLSDFQNPNRSFDDNLNYDSDSVIDSSRLINVETEELKSKRSVLGESVLWDKLENWVEQYRKDIKDWGIGSAPIFTVFEDLEGNVKWVSVNEDEIVRRSRGEESTEVNLKILCAQSLAREMGSGKNNVILRNSSVAKFVVQGGESAFFKAIQGFTLRPELFPMMSSVGRLVLFGFVALWALKKLFSFGDKEVRHTEVEKEMIRRKIKSRKEKEMLEKFSVEVVQQTPEPIENRKPMIDKEQLMNSILKAKAGSDKSSLQDSSANPTAKSIDLDNRIQEIRQMARHVRDIEEQELSLTDQGAKEKQGVNNELSNEMELVNVHSDDNKSFLGQTNGIHETVKTGNLDVRKIDDSGFLSKVSSTEDNIQGCTISGENVSSDRESTVQGFKDSESALKLTDTTEVIQFSDTPYAESHMSRKGSIRAKTRVILSLKEARDYLSEKFHNQVPDTVSQVKTLPESDAVLRHPGDEGFSRRNTGHKLDVNDKVAAISGRTSNTTHSTKACKASAWKESVPTKNENSEDSEARCGVRDLGKPQTSLNHEGNRINVGTGPPAKIQNWIDANFHEVEPLVKKIGTGFKDNYMVAREKVNEQLDMDTEITQLAFNGDDSELEWMKDDDLREIVFQVRENELAGRDPFYLMDAEDKRVFFMGLEKKVEKENEKLLKLHELLHSNIENLDYGADGISLYDPPSKIIPRWKGPLIEKNPEFLKNFLEEQKAFLAGNTGNSYPVKDQENSIKKSTGSPTPGNVASSLPTLDSEKNFHDEDPKNSRTVIEGSDGSVIAGKRSGKEYWQHTKKWSHGFLDSYNAETDPEVKSVMRNMGKDLDRWITEKEIQEAADLMSKVPERNKKFMEKKLNKLKREMELFGPQAVVTKYREYADEKEEDYLWWLDLPHLLCIELYTVNNGEQMVGLYSLEMATDLELEPKPYHVIAFEDAGDCKNLCYIIQAHMDMLGNGHAFVVPRPPKDAFWEAKANGFSVTVIRKGELQLNVDQTLEEVEEQITEIGSKIYQDKIMKERSVDISSLMKGVFGVTGKPTKRKGLKQMLRKSNKK